MFNDLQNFLNYDSLKPTFTLIESRNNNNEGLFLINHLLSNIVKNESATCFITVQQTLSHYKSIQTKIGNLNKFAKLIDNGTITHIDGLEELNCACSDPISDIFTVFFNKIYLHLGQTRAKLQYLIIDDLSIVYLLGCSLSRIYEFLFKLKNTYSWLNLIVYVKSFCDVDWDCLIRDFAYLSDLYLIASDLTTGYSKDIHGQVKLMALFLL
jgi:hypothetical protein